MFNLSTGQFLTGDSLATLCFVRKTCSAASILFWSAPALTRLKIVVVVASKAVCSKGQSMLRNKPTKGRFRLWVFIFPEPNLAPAPIVTLINFICP